MYPFSQGKEALDIEYCKRCISEARLLPVGRVNHHPVRDWIGIFLSKAEICVGHAVERLLGNLFTCRPAEWHKDEWVRFSPNVGPDFGV